MDSLLGTPAGLVTVLVVLISLLVGILQMSQSKPKVALNSEEWQEFPLIAKKHLSHDTRLFRFALPSPDHILGLPIGQHISFKFVDDRGKLVQRSYTPVTSDIERGYVEFVIKVYFKNVHPKFPEGGKMSQHLENLAIGDKMLFKGPKGTVTYKGNGKFDIVRNRVSQPYKVKKLGMIAGGTGITPMLQIIRAVLRDPNDKTEMYLIFANQTEDDILLREELEGLPSDRLHLWYTLDRPPKDWSYSSGFIDAEMCRKHLPPAEDGTMVFVCGPPPMIKYACEPAFSEIGLDDSQWHAF